MEKKKYFVVYGNFGNQYQLFWTLDSGIRPNAPDYMRKFNTAEFLKQYPNAERITRKEAIRLAREERERRRVNPSFAYYASKDVVPYGACAGYGVAIFPGKYVYI